MRKIFLENLPRKGKIMDWKKSIGYKVRFIYDDIEGEIVIVGYNKNKKGYLTIKYKNYNEFEILTGSFQKCKIGAYLNNIIIKAPWMVKYFQGGYDEAKKFGVKRINNSSLGVKNLTTKSRTIKLNVITSA